MRFMVSFKQAQVSCNSMLFPFDTFSAKSIHIIAFVFTVLINAFVGFKFAQFTSRACYHSLNFISRFKSSLTYTGVNKLGFGKEQHSLLRTYTTTVYRGLMECILVVLFSCRGHVSAQKCTNRNSTTQNISTNKNFAKHGPL